MTEAVVKKTLYPKRRLLRKALLLVVAVVVVGHGGAGWYQQHELNREVAVLRAAGEPMDAGELGNPRVAADRNAVNDLRAAEKAAMDFDDPDLGYLEFPFSAAEAGRIEKSLRGREEVLAHV